MMSIQITITGNLTAEPQAKLTGTGKAVAHFTVISNARYQDRESGQWVDAAATAVRVTCWGNLAEQVTDLGKGAKVAVVGHKLTTDAYLTRDGQAAATLEVTADQVHLALRQPASLG